MNHFYLTNKIFVLWGVPMPILWRILWRLSPTIWNQRHNIQTIKVATKIESQFIWSSPTRDSNAKKSTGCFHIPWFRTWISCRKKICFYFTWVLRLSFYSHKCFSHQLSKCLIYFSYFILAQMTQHLSANCYSHSSIHLYMQESKNSMILFLSLTEQQTSRITNAKLLPIFLFCRNVGGSRSRRGEAGEAALILWVASIPAKKRKCCGPPALKQHSETVALTTSNKEANKNSFNVFFMHNVWRGLLDRWPICQNLRLLKSRLASLEK